jgi:formylglycine-generating enzyme required for sulfatase activity
MLMWVSHPGCGPSESSSPVSLVTLPGGRVTLGSASAPRGGAPRQVEVPPFCLARHEVTVAAYCAFLNATDPAGDREHPQLVWRGDRRLPRAGHHRKAVAWIDFGEAEAYCAWLSARLGRTCRLPTADEWEYAAQAGPAGAPYPWGWGDPHGRAAFDLDGPLRVGLFPANGKGLHDLAGGVAEWCAGQAGGDGSRLAKGGSWAERDPAQVTVYGAVHLPATYRDADVGFRIAADVGEPVRASTQTHP